MSAATTMPMDAADCPGKVSSSSSPRSCTPEATAGTRLLVAVARDPGGESAQRTLAAPAEDPIAQSALAALTRRLEQGQETAAREFGIVKSDLTAVRLQVGNLGEQVDALADEPRGLNEKIDRNQAQFVELLTAMVGRNPDAS